MVEQFWSNPKVVSHFVSHCPFETPKKLRFKQLSLEARVGIGRKSVYRQPNNRRFPLILQGKLAVTRGN